MVNVIVYFEGGDTLQAPDNTEVLRQSFNKLLNAGLKAMGKAEVQIEARPMGSITNAGAIANRLIANQSFMLIDLDKCSDDVTKNETDDAAKIIRLNQFYPNPNAQSRIFFMVQAMEAWILSQPQAIENALNKQPNYVKIKNLTPITQPSQLCKPEEELNVLLMRNFEKSGKKAKYKGHKLKLAPYFIEELDIEQLQNDFVDVKNLLAAIPA